MSTDDAVNLNATIRPRNLPDSVKDLRQRAADIDRREWDVVRPRIETHLTAYKLVVGHLETLHAHVVETTDIDPNDRTRPAAMWLMAGRCLGMMRLALVAVEAGVCGEVLVVIRGLHEARELLMVLGDQNEDALLRVWLDDAGKHKYVSLAKSLNAHERFEEMLAEAMQRHGYGELRRSTEVSADMYAVLSRAGHNRRSAVIDAWWPEGRRMAYGPHWSAIRRAEYVRYVGSNLSGLVGIVGDAMRPMLPPGTWEKQWGPLRESVDAMDVVAPLDVESIRRAAGTHTA